MRQTRMYRQTVAVIVTAAGISLWPGMNSAAVAQSSGNAAKESSPPFLRGDQAAKPLPATKDPAQYADPRVARAYRIARSIPAVVAQQPCFCWCSRGGHRSLLDCYIDDHAAHCETCMKEAFLADRMQRQGKSAAAIRAAIQNGEWQNL